MHCEAFTSSSQLSEEIDYSSPVCDGYSDASNGGQDMPLLQTGFSHQVLSNNGEPLDLFCFKPISYVDGPLIIVFHGIKRNAQDYLNFSLPLAENHRAIVVAPLFDEERFPTMRYQRGGVFSNANDGNASSRFRPAESWTFSVVPRIVAHIRLLQRAPQLPYYLVGHSAGAQFLVRLAALLPGSARRIVAANPGSCIFPSREHEFGYGFGKLPDHLSSDAALQRYLSAPLTLLLGQDDIIVNVRTLDVSPGAQRQGDNRLERGRACFAAAMDLGRQRGWVVAWRRVEVPAVGHQASLMLASSEMGQALFGPS